MCPVSPSQRSSSPYAEVIAVLALSWLLIGAHAMSPVDIGLGGWSLARPQVAPKADAQLPAGPLAPPVVCPTSKAIKSEADRSSSSSPRADDAPPPARSGAGPRARSPVDHRPQRILLFGDSMVPIIAPRLTDYCARNGHELFPVIWYGGTIMIWAWQPRLDLLISEIQPTMLIAVLGSTELRTRNAEARRDYVRWLARKAGDRKFAWIGPPNWRDDTGINAVLLEELGPDRFFSSASLELQRKSDGVHPTQEAGAKWVDHFVSWLGSHGAHPIKLDRPELRAPPVAARVFHDVPDIPRFVAP